MNIIPGTIAAILITLSGYAQNWSTFGGSSSRNGLSEITGPQSVLTPYWSVSSSNSTTLGNAVYTFGDRFVTSRVEFSPYHGLVECRNLQNGALEWSSPFISSTSILYVIGYNEDGVYAHDYSTDTIYALRPDDGSIKWRSKLKSQTFGAYPGCVFACNGDLIVNGPLGSGMFTMRLNKNSGDTVWTNAELIAIGPAVGLAASESTVYRITGGITIPILLSAIDINTGHTKYSSLPIAGDPDQENPITLGSDGKIYFWRDGGYLYSYSDNGSALIPDWTFVPQTTSGAALSGDISIGKDNNLYVLADGKLKRINHITGVVMDSSLISISTGVVSAGADSTVYVNDKDGNFYAFSMDLQVIKWQYLMNGNTYCNMGLAKDGIMVFTGSGNQIVSFQGPQNIAPVADFRCSNTNPVSGSSVDFYDQSSYGPMTWQWNFPGGNPSSGTLQNPAGITYNTPGIYEVSLTVQNSSGADSVLKKCYLEVADATGNNEPASQVNFGVIPNPAASQIEVSGIASEYIIADISGRILMHFINSGKTDVSSLAPGIYFITEKNSGSTIRFIRSGY